MTPMRLFTAIQLPEDVRGRLAALTRRWSENWKEELLGLSNREYPPAKWVPADNLHVTLKFFGEVADADVNALCDALRGVALAEAPEVVADHVECLPPHGPVRVISIGLGGEAGRIESVFQQIEQRTVPLGFRSEERGYRPHITLARMKEPLPRHTRESLAQAAVGQLTAAPFHVREFTLMQSILGRGQPQYHPIARFPLGSGLP